MAIAKECLIVAGRALILAISHVLVEGLLALIAAGAVRVAVGAARNEVVTLLDDHGRLRRDDVAIVFVVLDGLSDETGASLDALDKLLIRILGRSYSIITNRHNEVDVVFFRDISALSAASDQLTTLLALDSIADINISIRAFTFKFLNVKKPSILSFAILAFAVTVDSGNVRVANLARVCLLALLAVRKSIALARLASL